MKKEQKEMPPLTLADLFKDYKGDYDTPFIWDEEEDEWPE
jgi:hypothetical protein